MQCSKTNDLNRKCQRPHTVQSASQSSLEFVYQHPKFIEQRSCHKEKKKKKKLQEFFFILFCAILLSSQKLSNTNDPSAEIKMKKGTYVLRCRVFLIPEGSECRSPPAPNLWSAHPRYPSVHLLRGRIRTKKDIYHLCMSIY